jgi:ergothioneine biosynthesis protein EgtB
MEPAKKSAGDPTGFAADDLAARLRSVRERTCALCAPLAIEDHVVQPSPEVSPPKWHLAHTTWFFEKFVLEPRPRGYRPFDERYHPLFNSYYKSVGPHWLQAERGALSRPTVSEVHGYRRHVDEALEDGLRRGLDEALRFPLELGIHHEQQHQELLLMDIKYILGANPLQPEYGFVEFEAAPGAAQWRDFEAGIHSIGAPPGGFAFDNERPRHRVWLDGFALRPRPVTNGEFREFVEDGGYADPRLWLSAGWDWVGRQRIEAPLYWRRSDGEWTLFTLGGVRPLDPDWPVCHVSYFEADAFARWKGVRLPTEAELEVFLEAEPADQPVWCWTRSAYAPYPRFAPFPGAFAEYNGKFMCSQMVLRGGCLATPAGHGRPTYRNFFEPHQRWMFSGMRLARD